MGSTDTYRRAMPCFNSPHSLVHSTGESYGGVFVPMLAQLIVKHNAQQQERQQQQLLGRAYPRIPPLTHPHPINLVGYMIGNAVTNDAFDGNGQVEFAYGMGLIAPPLQEALQADCQGSYWNATRGEGDRPGGEQAGRLQGGTHCLSLGWPERVKPPRLINDCFLRPYSCSGSACRQRLDEVADIIHDHLNPYSILKDCHYQNNDVAAMAAPLKPFEREPSIVYANALTREVNQKQMRDRAAKLTDIETRLHDMDRMGIDVQVVSPSPSQYYYYADADFGRQLSRATNDRIAQIVAGNPDRFAGMCTVPLQDPGMAARELERCEDAGGAGAHDDDVELLPIHVAPRRWRAADARYSGGSMACTGGAMVDPLGGFTKRM